MTVNGAAAREELLDESLTRFYFSSDSAVESSCLCRQQGSSLVFGFSSVKFSRKNLEDYLPVVHSVSTFIVGVDGVFVSNLRCSASLLVHVSPPYQLGTETPALPS